jgi:hypothetical protein
MSSSPSRLRSCIGIVWPTYVRRHDFSSEKFVKLDAPRQLCKLTLPV